MIKSWVLKKVLIIKQQSIKLINGKCQTNRDQKSNFYSDMINLKNFDSNLLKIDKNYYKGINIYYIGYITIKKTDDCENIYSVNLLHLLVNHASGYIKEKMEINT